ncbi:MAG: hypothetical protein AAGB15_10895 [Pseudomonadota bacterium]
MDDRAPKPSPEAMARAGRTLAMLLARASTDFDTEDSTAPGVVAIRTVPFEVLAADTGVRQLPRTINASDGQSLRVSFQDDSGALNVDIQAVGFPQIKAVQRRMARLVSKDGTVDYTFRFDRRGCATLQLSGSDAVRQALVDDFRIDIED